MVKFLDTEPRKPIDRAGRVEIHERMFGAKCDSMTVEEIDNNIKRFGTCECMQDHCKKQPLRGYCEYDHRFPLAQSKKGCAIVWRALTKACHLQKTRKDNFNTRKLKKASQKYGELAELEAATESPKSKLSGSRSLSHPTLKRKMDGSVVPR